MAGEWLKMECATPDKPEVLALTVKMGWDDPDLTVGKLFRLWRWFDQQTTDGNARGVTPALLDRQVGVSGFIEALAQVGWLTVTADGVRLHNFDRHNGKTAKERALTAKRVANHKTNAEANAEANGVGNVATVSGALPREEKKREDKKPPKSPKGEPDGFGEWYAAYPKKDGKVAAVKAFAKVITPLPVLLAALEWQRRLPGWTKDGGQYIPLPATYLNNERWNDERPALADETEWHATRSGVERKALQIGLKAWNEMEEQWPTYRQRVMRAVKDKDEPGLSLGDLSKLAASRIGATA